MNTRRVAFLAASTAWLWVLVLGVGLISVAGLTAVANEPAAPHDASRWEKAIQRFESWDAQNSVPDEAVLFVGSSSIRMWPTQRSFPQLKVINRGFGGSHIADVSAFVDRIVIPYKPAAIVFYAGDNDIAAGKTPDRVLADYRAFVSAVEAALPKTPIVFLPIKPSLNRWKHWPAMKEANALIEEYSAGAEHLHYVDLATPMLGADGEPRKELFIEDGLHLSPEGYALWSKDLLPVIEGLPHG